eukprot:m.294573 g.294573  ORF g.294573 m.294573 type:complete len:92 (-) comp16257_c0_seq3:1713-1988(-)
MSADGALAASGDATQTESTLQDSAHDSTRQGELLVYSLQLEFPWIILAFPIILSPGSKVFRLSREEVPASNCSPQSVYCSLFAPVPHFHVS